MLRAVIDAGFNSFRMSVYDVYENGYFRNLGFLKDFVRIGEGVQERGYISEEKASLAESIMRKYAQVMDKRGIELAGAVGTSTFRYASNGKEVADRLSRALGRRISVISGEEEGVFSFIGIANTLPLRDAVTFDLGGGSLEIVTAKGRTVEKVYHFPVGALRAVGLNTEQKIREWVRSEIGSLNVGKFPLYGSGGNLRALAKMHLKLHGDPLRTIHGYVFRKEDIFKYSRLLMSMNIEERTDLPGIGKDRAYTIHTASVIIDEVMEILGADSVTVSAFGLREGILMNRVVPTVEALREGWLWTIAKIFGVEPPFNVLQRSEDYREGVSAFLSAIMKEFSFLDPFDACYNTFSNLTVPGFSRDEVKLILSLCGSAGRKKMKKRFRELARGLMKKQALMESSRRVRKLVEEYNQWG